MLDYSGVSATILALRTLRRGSIPTPASMFSGTYRKVRRLKTDPRLVLVMHSPKASGLTV
jgi:hypothetical protein